MCGGYSVLARSNEIFWKSLTKSVHHTLPTLQSTLTKKINISWKRKKFRLIVELYQRWQSRLQGVSSFEVFVELFPPSSTCRHLDCQGRALFETFLSHLYNRISIARTKNISHSKPTKIRQNSAVKHHDLIILFFFFRNKSFYFPSRFREIQLTKTFRMVKSDALSTVKTIFKLKVFNFNLFGQTCKIALSCLKIFCERC